MAAPPGGSIAMTESANCRPRKHALDPAANAIGGLRYLFPNCLKNLDDMRCPNIIDGQVANRGQHVLFDRSAPLPTMLGVSPAIFMRSEARLETRFERHGASLRSNALKLFGTGLLAGRKRINPIKELQPHSLCLGAGIGETHCVRRAEANSVTVAQILPTESPR